MPLRGFAKLFRDLTERHQAREALRERDWRPRAALAAGRVGTWLWDIAADLHTPDESLCGRPGRPPDTSPLPLAGFLTFVHPDDRRAVADAFARAAGQGAPVNVEFRVPLPGDGTRGLRDQGDVVPDADGRPA